MEKIEKLERQISDLEAEIRLLSAKAESAEDTEDKKYYRALVLSSKERLVKMEENLVKEKDLLVKKEENLGKEKDLLIKEKDLLVKKEEKEILLLEKDKDLRKENLLRLQRQGARGSAAGLGVESTAGSVPISGVNSTTWEGISGSYHVHIQMVSTAPLTAAEVHETEPFSWQLQGEANPINRKAAVQYLSHMVPPPAGQEWYDGAARRNMLDCTLPMAGIKLRGSCDIALCTSVAVRGNQPEYGLRIVVELKKAEVNFNSHQLGAELLAANRRSPFLKPIGVMTDLMDAWYLMWAAEHSMKLYICRGRAEAIGILRAFLEQELLTPDSGSIMHQQDKGGPEAEVGGLLKRRGLLLASGAREDVANLDDLLDFGGGLGLSDTDLHQLRCASQLVSLWQLASPRLGAAAQNSWNTGAAAEAEVVGVPFPMMYS
ncbi:hypothetical protein Vretifemale_13015 [Volvox reticuliferus]|uniref:Uncharacterized protein n=1 Tax=Volvox reticuliferus TaxID=1737510 RepID=A0A8J4CLY4_9CHLO|nr:hypothetical protein Vretifemale_13015 [Volvox reticuliferus]